MTQIHISQIDIQSAVLTRLSEISSEIQQVKRYGVDTDITAQDLFHLEALGLVYDFTTGLVSSESECELVQAVEAKELVS